MDLAGYCNWVNVVCQVLSLETGISLFPSLPNATAFLDVFGFLLVDAAANCLLELAAALTATRFIAATGGKVLWAKWDHFQKSFQKFQMQIQRNIQAAYSFWLVA